MKLTKLLTLSSLLLGTLTACNDIDQADRFQPVDVTAQKNVLIEDFTGQHCVNCPKAADEVQTMQRTFGERIVAVSIHGGSLSMHDSESSGLGLATDEGEAYNAKWDVKSWPKGMVDRTGGLLDYEQWNGAAIGRFAQTPKVNITADHIAFDESTRTLTLTTTLSGNEQATGHLQVWLTESSITAPQTLPSGVTDANYVHNHVYRAAVNGTDGEEMTVREGESITKEYTYRFARDYWNAENASVVIFFYNDAEGVMQVIDASVSGGDTPPADKPLTGLALDKSTLSLIKGGNATLSCIFTPSDATDKSVEWTTSDEAVATVSDEGVVTGVGAGTATITVSSVANPDVKATCEVTVTQPESNNPVQVMYNGQRVHDGDVLIMPVVAVDYGGGFMAFEYGDDSHGCDPTFVNTETGSPLGKNVTVKVRLAGNYAPWAICGLGYNICMTMTTSSFESTFTVPSSGSVDSQIHYDGFTMGTAGTADIICDAVVNGEPMTYTIRYVYDGTK